MENDFMSGLTPHVSKIARIALIAAFIGSIVVSFGAFRLLRLSGLEAYNEKNFDRAARYLFPSAFMGDAQTQALIGQMTGT